MNFAAMTLNRRALLAGIGTTAAVGAVIGDAGTARAEAAPAVAAPEPAADPGTLARVKVDLLAPPFVHPHDQVAVGGPKIVEFRLTVKEKPVVVDDDGTTIQGMTFNGSIPGPLMVVHQDDYVELTLANDANNLMAHNIDLHATTGGAGGGALTMINPGEETTLRFKATRVGAFIYHCAVGGEMTPWHINSGMNGAILVLPRDGLKDGAGRPLKYDRIYYIGEQDYYVPRNADGSFRKCDSIGDEFADAFAAMKGLIPTHVVFNGAVGALTGKRALTANVGENVLIIHSTPMRDTRPHLIGGHGDYVWTDGKFGNPPSLGLETWRVAGGSAAVALYRFRQPGIYAYVNHNLIEAVYLGATAEFKVEGKWNNDLMQVVTPPRPIA